MSDNENLYFLCGHNRGEYKAKDIYLHYTRRDNFMPELIEKVLEKAADSSMKSVFI